MVIAVYVIQMEAGIVIVRTIPNPHVVRLVKILKYNVMSYRYSNVPVFNMHISNETITSKVGNRSTSYVEKNKGNLFLL